MSETSHTAGSAGPRHELTDVDPRPLKVYAGVMFLMLVVALGAMWLLFRQFSAQEAREAPPPSPLAGARTLPPPPRLQNMDTQRRDLLELRAGEEAVLDSYGWVDRGNGVVRIPVDRAIELLAQRGLPVQEKKK